MIYALDTNVIYDILLADQEFGPSSRDFVNIYGGYGGWSLANVPNPCPAAFVIISSDGKKRSNVLVGSWSR